MKKAKFPAKWLRGLVEVAARDTSRYAIAGVNLESKGAKVVLAATDGRRLLGIEGENKLLDGWSSSDPPLEGFDLVIPAKVIKDLKIKKSDGDIEIEMVGHGLDFKAKMGSVSIEASGLEGNFPPYRDVIPDHELGLESMIGFSPKLLSGMLKGFDLATDPEGAVKMSVYAPNKPLKFERDDGVGKMVGVLMPVSIAA